MRSRRLRARILGSGTRIGLVPTEQGRSPLQGLKLVADAASSTVSDPQHSSGMDHTVDRPKTGEP